MPPLIAAVRPVTEGRQAWRQTTLAITWLGEIGSPAAEAAPLLKQILDADRRPVAPGQWRSIPDDDALRGIAVTALERMNPALGPCITET